MSKKIILAAFIFIFVIFFTYNILIKKTFVVGKSDWPAWDLFEYSQPSLNIFSKYNLKFSHFNNYQNIVDSFINNEIDIATITLFEALYISSKIEDQLSIVLLLDYTTGGDAIISQKNIQFLDHLEGKTVGIEKNTVSYFTLLRALKKAGISEDKIFIKEYQLFDLISEFKNKNLDAISLYDPYIYELNKYTNDLNIVFSSKEIPREICDVVILRKKVADDHPMLVKSIQKNWFNLTSKDLPFKKLKNPMYKNSDYVDHIRSNIYIANENENKYAFGTKNHPGYLKDTIIKINTILHNDNNVTVDENVLTNILHIKK
tara:strand:- start:1729 stop:2679 length:951 start_codon:yes stop_codon:yes gene_type:complete